jgi:hypothetical protein
MEWAADECREDQMLWDTAHKYYKGNTKDWFMGISIIENEHRYTDLKQILSVGIISKSMTVQKRK